MVQKWCIVGTIILVGILHVPAVFYNWYFFLWWYDVMMHMLGGVAMGLLGSGILRMILGKKVHLTPWALGFLYVGFVLGFVALIGIGWEWLEGIVDAVLLPQLHMGNAQLGLVDTLLDLYFDLMGGVLGLCISAILFLKPLFLKR